MHAMAIDPRSPLGVALAVGIQKLRERLAGVDPAAQAEQREQRRRLAGDPWRYCRDVLRVRLSAQQEAVLEAIEQSDRVLVPSAANVGKTFLLAAYGLYRFDAVAALPDPDLGLEEQGALVLLPGPDHATIYATVYGAMLEHAERAERAGWRLPGERSTKSVSWKVRPRWQIEPFSPRERVQQEVSPSALGRHHRNQVALIEEAQGVDERLFRAVEGMCSGAGNKIICAFNPTEPRGPVYARALAGGWTLLHLSALDHPNVRERRVVIPGAVDVRVLEQRIPVECQDLGPAQRVAPSPEHEDFCYALPPAGAADPAPRTDGVPGHAAGEPRIYRPGPVFTAQVLGRWPRETASGLFDPAAVDAAMARWREGPQPDGLPDLVGVDVARYGEDETVAAARWGPEAESLLRATAPTERQWIALEVIPPGDGVQTARALSSRWPGAPSAVDEEGVGASVYDQLSRVLGFPAEAVSFAAAPRAPVPGEPYAANWRAQMYVRLSMLVRRGLVALPPDPLLREELLATEVEYVAKTVRVAGGVERHPAVQLASKDELRRKLGRSPDRADAVVMAVNGSARVRAAVMIGRA